MSLKVPILLGFVLLCIPACREKTINKETVKHLDIQRYMGKWFEIARFDYHFEHNLVGSTVEYTLLPDGTIEVLNCGYCDDFSGPCKKARGIARMVDPQRPGKMKVSFLLNFYAEYNVLEVDEKNYRYALIGSNTPYYLWLISRTPRVSTDTIRYFLDCARQRGYDVSMLKWIKHKEQSSWKEAGQR